MAHSPPLFSCDKHKANMWKDKQGLFLSKGREAGRLKQLDGIIWTLFCSDYGCVRLGSREPKGFE